MKRGGHEAALFIYFMCFRVTKVYALDAPSTLVLLPIDLNCHAPRLYFPPRGF